MASCQDRKGSVEEMNEEYDEERIKKLDETVERMFRYIFGVFVFVAILILLTS